MLQQMHTALMALTSCEANDIVANSLKNLLEAWRRLQKRCDPTTGGRKRNLMRTIISPGRCSLLELQAGVERWESCVSRYKKNMKDKLDDEIKLAGLESLVREELEKHLILNSNRLRTFEDARLEVVTWRRSSVREFVIPSRVTRVLVDTRIPWMLMPSTLSRRPKEKDHPVRAMGVLSAVEHIFNEIAMHAKAQASNRMAKANRASHGPRVRAKARVKETRENPKELKVRTKVPKAHTKAKHRKLVSQVLKTRNRMQARTFRNLHIHVPLTLLGTMVGMVTNGTMAGVLMSGMMTGVLLDGMKVGNKRMTLPQAHFHLEVWMSVPPVVRSGLNG